MQKVNRKISIEYENTKRGPRSLSRHRRSLDSGSESGSRGSSGDEETVESTGKRYWPFHADKVQVRPPQPPSRDDSHPYEVSISSPSTI